MDSASSLAYPGSRILAGWSRQLQPHNPTALWVGYLFVHRVEALAESIEPRPVDALALHVLQALAVPTTAAGTGDAEPLSGRLHLPRAAVHQLLRRMQGEDLVYHAGPGWCLSERGRAVLAARADPTPQRERRVFSFVERLTPTGRRLGPPHYLPLHECAAVPWEVGEGHRFDVRWLAESTAFDAAWRERFAFPAGVHRILTTSDEEANGVWERVIVDRPERIAIALAATAERTWLGFAAEADGWKLHAQTPVLRLPESALEALPEVTLPPTAWQEAWRLWCRQRHLPLSEADACRLQQTGVHLDVHASAALIERLRATKSDILREESGLIAGDGYLRAAAILRIQDPLGD